MFGNIVSAWPKLEMDHAAHAQLKMAGWKTNHIDMTVLAVGPGTVSALAISWSSLPLIAIAAM